MNPRLRRIRLAQRRRLILEAAAPAAPAPYDLSGFTIAYQVTWPTVPNTTLPDYNVTAGDAADLASAVTTGGRRVIVPAGTYTMAGGNLNITVDDLDLVLDNNATIVGGLQINQADRVRVTGGRLLNSGLNSAMTACNDLLINNLYAESNISLFGTDTASCNRVGLINSSFDTSAQTATFAIFFDPEVDFSRPHHTDVTIANCHFDAGIGQSTGSTRFQYVDRLTLVDSWIWATNHTSGTSLRMGWEVNQGHVENVIAPGFFHLTFIGTLNEAAYATQNIYFKNVQRYFVNGAQGYSWEGQSAPNSGTVEYTTGVYYTNIPAQIGNVVSSGVFTGVNIPASLSWDGVTMPDDSVYGADHT